MRQGGRRRQRDRHRHVGGQLPHYPQRDVCPNTKTMTSPRLTLACVIIAMSTTAYAQSVTNVLTFLLQNQSVQTGSPERDRAATQATTDTISRALLANLAT